MPDYMTMLEQLRDAYNGRDPDTWCEMWVADCEWHPFLTAREEGDPGYHGHNGMRAWFEDVDEMFAQIQVEMHRFRRVGDRLVVLGQMTARRRGGDAEVTSEVGWVMEPRDEGFHRGWAYDSHEAAERAANEMAG